MGFLVPILSIGSMIISGLSLMNDSEKHNTPMISNTAAIIIAIIAIYILINHKKV